MVLSQTRVFAKFTNDQEEIDLFGNLAVANNVVITLWLELKQFVLLEVGLDPNFSHSVA